MRQAITTKFLGPTDHKPSRIVVRADAGRMIVSWDHNLDVAANHTAAAEAFARKLGWLDRCKIFGGGLHKSNPEAYAFVLVPMGEL